MFELSTRSSFSTWAACVLMRCNSPRGKFLVQLLMLPKTRSKKDEIEVETHENDKRNRTVTILALVMSFGASVCAVMTVEGFKGPVLFKIHLADVF